MLSGNIPVLNRGGASYVPLIIGGNDKYTKIYYNFDAGAPTGTLWPNLGAGATASGLPNIAAGPGVANNTGMAAISGANNSLGMNVPNGYAQLQNNTVDLDFGAPSGNANDFSIDWWAYYTGFPVNTVALARDISAAYQPWILGYVATAGSGALTCYASSNNSSWDIASAQPIGTVSTGQWNHFAFGRQGTTFSTWCNGAAISAWTNAAALAGPPINGYCAIGCWNAASSPYFNGNIIVDELRVSKGICRLTPGVNYVPKTWSVHNNALSGGNDSLVKCLLHFDGSVTDTCAGATPHVFTLKGSAALTTSDKKFGSGCLQVGNTSGDRLTCPDSPDFDFSNGNFTIDMWVKRLVASGGPSVTWITKRASNSVTAPFLFFDNGTNILAYASATLGSWDALNGVTLVGQPTQNVWTHYAFVRLGNTLLTFINGVLINRANYLTGSPLLVNTGPLCIGGEDNGVGSGSYLFDEVRITKGGARWWENFYPALMTQPY